MNIKNQINNSGFTYDAAGNLTSDGSLSATYDAENRITSTNAGVSYLYDGEGKRVAKATPGAPPQPFKLYWYGLSNDALVETDAAGNNSVEYVFFGGKRIARRTVSSGAVNYYFADHLGSSRVVTNAARTILDDSDFYPFGGERVISSSSGNNYKFTGKERDPESGLDYFIARSFSAAYGRFQSPDPENAGSKPDDAQSWNAYTYARNNPLLYVDPRGLDYNVYINGGGKHVVGTWTDLVNFAAGFGGYPSGSEDRGSIVACSSDKNQECEIIGTYTWFFGDASRKAIIRAAGERADEEIKKSLQIMAEYAAFTAGGAAFGLLERLLGAKLLQLGVSGKILKVVVNVAHAANTGHLSVPVQKAARAVEQAILSGKYRVVTEGTQTLIRGEVVVDGVRVGFKGKVIEGIARVGTMFDVK